MSSDPAPAAPRAYKSRQRDASAAQTRESLIAAARTLLAGNGPARLSLDAVARAAGVTRLTVYHQFGSRRALLEAIFDTLALEGGLQRIGAAMAVDDPHEGLRQLVAVLCDFYAAVHGVIAPLMAAGAADPEFKQAMQERSERRRTVLRKLVGKMQQRGEIAAERVDALVDLLWALISPSFLGELTANGRSVVEACALLQGVVASEVKRASACA
jgi:AcrR family transcriptional regulator